MFVARHLKADAAKKIFQSIQGGYNFSFSQFFFLKSQFIGQSGFRESDGLRSGVFFFAKSNGLRTG